MSIKATSIAKLARSNRTITLTTQPGTVMVPSGLGERAASYDAGEVVICDKDATIAGPLSRDDAIALATAVLEGQPRAVTHPQLHLLLAGAVLAFVTPSPEPLPPDTEGTDDDRGGRKQDAQS